MRNSSSKIDGTFIEEILDKHVRFITNTLYGGSTTRRRATNFYTTSNFLVGIIIHIAIPAITTG